MDQAFLLLEVTLYNQTVNIQVEMKTNQPSPLSRMTLTVMMCPVLQQQKILHQNLVSFFFFFFDLHFGILRLKIEVCVGSMHALLF